MALRKRPIIQDDRFGSAELGTFNDKPTRVNPTETETRQYVPNLTLPQAIEVLTILLLDYQCKGKLVETHSATTTNFRMWFPFAWHQIAEGDTIKNLTNGETYLVETLIKDHPEYPTNYTVLRGKTPPSPWHILRFDNKKNNLVQVLPAFPDTENKPYEFTSGGYVQKPDGDVWVDVITYAVVAEAPASLSGKMFGPSPHEDVPRFRENLSDMVRTYGQWIDTRVRFDFWTMTNAGSEKFREWFRDFSNKYRWLLEKNGVGRFLWHSSGTVSTATRWKGYIMHRSAYYDFRTEYSFYEELFRIRKGDIQVSVPGDGGNDATITASF